MKPLCCVNQSEHSSILKKNITDYFVWITEEMKCTQLTCSFKKEKALNSLYIKQTYNKLLKFSVHPDSYPLDLLLKKKKKNLNTDILNKNYNFPFWFFEQMNFVRAETFVVGNHDLYSCKQVNSSKHLMAPIKQMLLA